MALARAVFLDKDGTLIEDVPYNVDPACIRWVAGAREGLRRLHTLGYRLIIISNQSGVARGRFAEVALLRLEEYLWAQLAEAGVLLTDFYYCPHHPEGTIAPYAIECDCRKPRPGLLYRAAADHALALEHSWFIGDILNDVEAGRAATCQTILIDNGNESEWHLSRQRLPHHIVATLAEAVQVIAALHQPNFYL